MIREAIGLLTCMGGILCMARLAEGSAASSPTRWHLEVLGQNYRYIYLQCEGISTETSEKIRMEAVAKVRSEYGWRGRDNGGHGLDAARWTCACDDDPHPLNNPRSKRYRFSTDWGEDCTITMTPSDAAGQGICEVVKKD